MICSATTDFPDRMPPRIRLRVPGSADVGATVEHRTADDLNWLRAVCGSIDAGALRQRFADDLDAFRSALHQERARAVAEARRHRRGH